MKSKNNLTKNLVYLLVGAIVVYGVGVIYYQDFGGQRFDFSDGEEFKRGIFATNNIQTASESWIQWRVIYTDGSIEQGRTGKTLGSFTDESFNVDNTDFGANSDGSPFGLSLVKSIEDQRILQEAEFIVYTDMSQISQYLCFDTPRMTITQTVLVNGEKVNVPTQRVQYNELDARNILKGTGVKITPQFLESQIQLSTGKALESGDEIKFILDASGRFELIHLSEGIPSELICTNPPEYFAEGFIEGNHIEYNLIFGDPLDLLLGTFPNKQTEITDQAVTVNTCENGVCGEIIIEESPDTQIEQVAGCIGIYEPVCASDERTYSNSCVAESFDATVVYEGICIGETITEVLEPGTVVDNPTGIDGIVGVCDANITDCSFDSPDIENFVRNSQQDDFNFASFEFIMLVVIGMVIIVIIISRLVKK